MPDLRTPEIRLADALDRVAELEGCVMKNAESFQRVLDVAMRAEARIAELEAENKRLAELLADRESEDEGLAGLVMYQPITAAAQANSPFQTEMIANSAAQGLNTASQQPSNSSQAASAVCQPLVGQQDAAALWRALRAGNG